MKLKTNEWNLLKRRFDELSRDDNARPDSIEQILDADFHRRFAELINRVCGPRSTIRKPTCSRAVRKAPLFKMNQRDQDLLDKQLWGFSPRPPRNGGHNRLGGGRGVFGRYGHRRQVPFAHDSKLIQIASHETAAAISLLNGVPPTIR